LDLIANLENSTAKEFIKPNKAFLPIAYPEIPISEVNPLEEPTKIKEPPLYLIKFAQISLAFL
jgi:hypothetical protein